MWQCLSPSRAARARGTFFSGCHCAVCAPAAAFLFSHRSGDQAAAHG
nr:MAG TPA: hypothetical protein [Caudoviricetes sp.]